VTFTRCFCFKNTYNFFLKCFLRIHPLLFLLLCLLSQTSKGLMDSEQNYVDEGGGGRATPTSTLQTGASYHDGGTVVRDQCMSHQTGMPFWASPTEDK
jgi:hypothetical protein